MKEPESNELKNEIEKVLSGTEKLQFETISSEDDSPLNQAVVEKDHKLPPPPKEVFTENTSNETTKEAIPPTMEEAEDFSDAPEQEINQDGLNKEADFELPVETAKQAADTILGVTNNMLEIGGGYFVRIKKHKDFYELEEVIQVIDDQNERNVRKIKLDDDDKALIRPLLIQVLRKKAKLLTPEEQLIGAILSILVKKGQVVMQIRAENEILVERILEIIREEKGTNTESDQENPRQETKEENQNQDQKMSVVMEVAEDTKP
jgi:hypothetical protein